MAEASPAANVHPIASKQLEFLPDYLHDVKLIAEISIASWRRLFDVTGAPGTLKLKELDHKASAYGRLEQVLFSEKLSVEIIDAFETIAELGTSKGRDALHEAAANISVSRVSWPTMVGDGELVLELWLRQRTDARLLDAIEHARLRMFEMGTARPQQEFAGKAARPLRTDLDEIKTRVKKDAADWFCANDRGEYAEVRAFAREDGAVFQVVHGDPFRTEMSISDDGKARSSVRYRPGLADLIRYDANEGRLRIAARTSKLVNAYRTIFGEALFGDREFFGGKDNCTLRPLQEKGRALLENKSPNMVEVQVVELLWHHGGHSIRVEGEDCLAKMSLLELPTNEGQFVEAKFEFRFNRGKRIDRKAVKVQVPNRINNKPDRHEKAVDAFLQRIGIRLRGKPSEPSDLWSLYPWRYSPAKWCEVLGPQMAFFESASLFRTGAALQSVGHVEHATASTALRVLQEGNLLEGISHDPHVPSRVLYETEVDAYDLDVERLAHQLGGALGIAGPVKQLSGFVAGFDLGERHFGQTRVHIFFFGRRPGVGAADLTDRLQRLAGPKVRVGIVVPVGCATKTGLAEVELGTGQSPFDGVLRRLIGRLGLEKEASALEQAEPEHRLVIDPRQGAAYLDRFELTGIPEQSRTFKFLVELARANGEAVPHERLAEVLGGESGNPEAVRDIKRRTVEGIKLSYKKKGAPCPVLGEIIVTRAGGYALGVPAFIP